MRKARLPEGALGCAGVEHLAAGWAEVAVDGSSVERMGEGELCRDGELVHEVGRDGFINGIGWVRQFSDSRDRRRGGVLSQDRCRRQEGSREGRERRDPGQDHGGELPGRRESSPVTIQRVNTDLVEQCSAVEGVASSVRHQPRGPSLVSDPRSSAAARSTRSFASSPPSRIGVTRESPPRNRDQPGSIDPPARAEMTVNTLSALSRRRANSRAPEDGRSTHCKSSTTRTTT